MSIIKLLSGPLIGALIGYGTNYIAVKMLFRPLYPVKIGRYTLPFTPGIIPKGKERIAKALGGAVGGTLFTKEDIEQTLLSDKVKQSVIDNIMISIRQSENSDKTIKQMLQNYINQEDIESMNYYLESILCNKIADEIIKLDIGVLIGDVGGKAIKDKVHGTMLAIFANDKMIASIAEPIGDKVNEYILGDGREKILSIISEELEKAEDKTLKEALAVISIDEEKIQDLIEKVYMDLICSKAGLLIEHIDIAGVVENKVSSMDVLELEHLVLSVMKKELNQIVNLGAIIGFVIGLLNLLF